MATRREQVLGALFARLTTIIGATVLRNADKPEAIPEGGLIVLRDGDPGEPVEIYLSPLTYLYDHLATIEAFVRAPTPAERDAAIDVLIAKILPVLEADRTLGGLCDDLREQAPEIDDLEDEGAASDRAASIPIVLSYATSSPLA